MRRPGRWPRARLSCRRSLARARGEWPGELATQRSVAQALGLGVGELAGQAAVVGSSRSGREARRTSSSQTALRANSRKGSFARPVSLSSRMWSSTCVRGQVATLDERRVAGVGLIGEDRLEAVPVVVGEGQLRAGVRALAPHDHARPRRPTGKVELVGHTSATWPLVRESLPSGSSATIQASVVGDVRGSLRERPRWGS